VLLASTTVEVVLPVVSASNFHHASSLLDVAPYLFSLVTDYWKPIQKNVSSAETSVESSVQQLVVEVAPTWEWAPMCAGSVNTQQSSMSSQLYEAATTHALIVLHSWTQW
jgi:hypothetical protein